MTEQKESVLIARSGQVDKSAFQLFMTDMEEAGHPSFPYPEIMKPRRGGSTRAFYKGMGKPK